MQLVLALMPAPEADIAPLFRNDEMWAAMAQAVAALVHADFESVNPGSPGEQTYIGLDGFRDFWLDWLAPWASYRAEIGEAIDLGERVLVLAENFGCPHEGTHEVKVSAASIYMFSDGKIARYEGYLNRAEALKAAGLKR